MESGAAHFLIMASGLQAASLPGILVTMRLAGDRQRAHTVLDQ
jgi:hypothetical protein